MFLQNGIYLLALIIHLDINSISALDMRSQSIIKVSPSQMLVGYDEDVDIITGNAFAGLTTFANLRYQNCFADESELYDIAILGAPFDTVSQLVLYVVLIPITL